MICLFYGACIFEREKAKERVRERDVQMYINNIPIPLNLIHIYMCTVDYAYPFMFISLYDLINVYVLGTTD